MIYFPTGEQMRTADMHTIQEIGIPSLVLMERAALESVRCMEEQKLDFTNILVLCGSGNNGGDGYAIARLLHLKGYRVTVFFAGKPEKRSEENRVQASIIEHYNIPVITQLDENEYTVIIDAVFGTGLTREISGSYYTLLQQVNQMSGMKVAIDIPSGIHDSTGKVMGVAFQADMTIAIAFTKRGLLLRDGIAYAGTIFTRDIGITEESLPEGVMTYGFTREDLSERMPKRIHNSNKGTYGRLLMIVGSKGMSGAAYLCAKAAYAVGGGLVQIYTHEDNRVILQQLLPEAIITTYEAFDEEQLKQLLSWADLVTIGCGLGQSSLSEQLVACVLRETKQTCVIDADGLNLLAKHPEWYTFANDNWILTPHMKEMSRLLHCSVEELVEERVAYIQKFVEKFPGVCAMKDARTFVFQKGKQLYLNISGNAAMAKAGSGDVLAGMISGIAAQNITAYDASVLGVYLHGLCGDQARDDKGVYSVTASDLIAATGDVLRQI